MGIGEMKWQSGKGDRVEREGGGGEPGTERERERREAGRSEEGRGG